MIAFAVDQCWSHLSGRTSLAKMLSPFRPLVETAIGCCKPLSAVSCMLIVECWTQLWISIYKMNFALINLLMLSSMGLHCCYGLTLSLKARSVLWWIQFLQFFWFARWVKQQKRQIQWCKRCTLHIEQWHITMHICTTTNIVTTTSRTSKLLQCTCVNCVTVSVKTMSLYCTQVTNMYVCVFKGSYLPNFPFIHVSKHQFKTTEVFSTKRPSQFYTMNHTSLLEHC